MLLIKDAKKIKCQFSQSIQHLLYPIHHLLRYIQVKSQADGLRAESGGEDAFSFQFFQEIGGGRVASKVEDDDIGLYGADACYIRSGGQNGTNFTCPLIVDGQAVDIIFQGIQPRSGEVTRLAHPPSHDLAQATGLLDKTSLA